MINKIKVKDKKAVKVPDTPPNPLIPAVTTILFMETVLGSVRNPSLVLGRTRSQKDHEGQADLTTVKTSKKMTLSYRM